MHNSTGSTITCNFHILTVMTQVKLAALIICVLLMTTTLVLIVSHRRLRKQHNIFPFNLVLADLLGVVTFMAVDISWFISGEEVR